MANKIDWWNGGEVEASEEETYEEEDDSE